MNGFRKFKKIKNIQVNFKILLVNNTTPTSLKLTLSSPENIFMDSRFEVGKYHKDFEISREGWEKISGEEDYSKIENEFKDAVTEFNSVNDYCEYKNKVNLHLIEKAIKFLEKQN